MPTRATRSKAGSATPAKPKPNPITTRRIAAYEAAIRRERGERLTQKQTRDLTWLEKSARDEAVDDALRALPKGIYCELAGRQHKVIDDAAELYDLPIGGPVVDLYDAVHSLHNLIAENAHRLKANLDGDGDELQKEKLRQQIILLQRDIEGRDIKLAQAREESVDRTELTDLLTRLSSMLRNLGNQLGRDDPEVQRAFNEALESFAADLMGGGESP